MSPGDQLRWWSWLVLPIPLTSVKSRSFKRENLPMEIFCCFLFCFFYKSTTGCLSGLSRDQEQLQPLCHSANILAQGLSIYFHPLFFSFFVKGSGCSRSRDLRLSKGRLTFMMRVACGQGLRRKHMLEVFITVHQKEIGRTVTGLSGGVDTSMTLW